MPSTTPDAEKQKGKGIAPSSGNCQSRGAQRPLPDPCNGVMEKWGCSVQTGHCFREDIVPCVVCLPWRPHFHFCCPPPLPLSWQPHFQAQVFLQPKSLASPPQSNGRRLPFQLCWKLRSTKNNGRRGVCVCVSLRRVCRFFTI